METSDVTDTANWQAFTVMDTKAETAGPPFFQPNVGTALRSMGDALTRPDSPWAAHPEDYALYHIGSWDDTFMRLDGTDPVHVCNLSELTNKD